MPRTGPRRSLTTVAAVLAMLAAPAAAQAATYTINQGDGPCGGADLACGGFGDAAGAAAPGDVFNVSPSATPYGSATFDDGGITIAGTGPGVGINGSLVFSATSGGVSKLSKVFISPQTGSGPAVSVTGAAGLELSDAIILNPNGDGVQIHEGTTNKIVRSTIGTGGQATSAVHVFSADTSSAAKALTMESTLATGGNAGVTVETGVSGIVGSTAGDVTLTLRHVTSAGSTHGLVLDSNKAAGALLAPGVGNIVANVVDSIIQNGTALNPYPGLLTLINKNTITDTYTRTLMGAFDANAVFVDPATKKFHLKAGSPAINAGGFTPGESTTDFDGQDRSAAPTDQGADEYVAPPPPVIPPPPPPPGSAGDGDLPKVVITKPKQNQKLQIFKRVTKTTTVTKKGKKVKVKKKVVSKTRNKLTFSGTATDKSGIKGVVVTLERLSDDGKSATGTAAAATSKCKWLNGTKGIVSKACLKPVVLLAKFANGTWTYTVKPKLGAGQYRLIVAGADTTGGFGNSATPAEAIHRFTLVT